MNFGAMVRLAVLAVASSIAGCAQLMAPDEGPHASRQVDAGKGEPPLRLAVTDVGQGKPVILLHGLGASSYTWKQVTPALARHNRVIALDLKGFGASDKPHDDKYSIRDQADLVYAFMKQENLHNVTLVGHSFGGGVALALALKLAEEKDARVERLVLIDSLAYKQPIPFFFRVLKTPVVGEVGLGITPPEVQTAGALAIAFHDKGKLSADAVYTYARPLYTEGGRYALVRTVEQLVPDDIDVLSARYRSVKLPALLVWCRQDKIVPLSYGARLNADLSKSRMEVIEECGHIPQEEQPEATAQILEKFLLQ